MVALVMDTMGRPGWRVRLVTLVIVAVRRLGSCRVVVIWLGWVQVLVTRGGQGAGLLLVQVLVTRAGQGAGLLLVLVIKVLVRRPGQLRHLGEGREAGGGGGGGGVLAVNGSSCSSLVMVSGTSVML